MALLFTPVGFLIDGRLTPEAPIQEVLKSLLIN